MRALRLRKPVAGLLAAAASLALLLPKPPAQAYEYRTCDFGADKITWSEKCDGCARMKVSTISFPPGHPFTAEVNAAMDAWNAVDRSRFRFIKDVDTDGTSDDNRVNEVDFTDDLDGPGGVLAVTKTWYNGICLGPLDDADIFEADVEFDVTEPWVVGSFDPSAPGVHLRAVAVHEFGHALGLLHEDDVLDTMNSFYPLGGPVGHNKLTIPLADARQGVRFLYSEDGTALPDLVASNFKRTGSGSSALVSGPSSAYPGKSVTVEFTFMNLGSADAGSFNADFYLSTNDFITTADRLVGTTLISGAPAGGVWTFTHTLAIPTNTAPGTYHLGVLLDKDNSVVERDDSTSNNGLAQPRRITISYLRPLPF